MTTNTDSTEFSVEGLAAAARKAIPFLQAAMIAHEDAKPVRDALAAAVVAYDNTNTSGLKRLIVEYVEDHGESDMVEYFACWAEDNDHAKEQCEDAYPSCKVTAIFGLQHSYKQD